MLLIAESYSLLYTKPKQELHKNTFYYIHIPNNLLDFLPNDLRAYCSTEILVEL